jgi:hypothetical protein
MQGTRPIFVFLLAACATIAGCWDEPDPPHGCRWITGELAIDPAFGGIPATGELEAELAIIVYEIGEDCRKPLPGVLVEVFSSRNQGGNVVDFIEQPTGATDENGRATARLGSSECGEAQLAVYVAGAQLCSDWVNNQCTPLRALIYFTLVCDQGKSDCDCVCVDLQTAQWHCGECDIVCPAGQTCVDGVCQ